VGAGSGAGPGGAPPAPIDLNAASETDLDALPGVGPVLAGRILAWRAQHGRFTRVEELGEVSGIGDKLLAELTPLVRV
jgi:competence protein ComEA